MAEASLGQMIGPAGVLLGAAVVDYQIRKTVESAYLMGAQDLRALGYPEVDVIDASDDICLRDNERLSEQVQGDAMSGLGKLHIRPVPDPISGASALK